MIQLEIDIEICLFSSIVASRIMPLIYRQVETNLRVPYMHYKVFFLTEICIHN